MVGTVPWDHEGSNFIINLNYSGWMNEERKGKWKTIASFVYLPSGCANTRIHRRCIFWGTVLPSWSHRCRLGQRCPLRLGALDLWFSLELRKRRQCYHLKEKLVNVRIIALLFRIMNCDYWLLFFWIWFWKNFGSYLTPFYANTYG